MCSLIKAVKKAQSVLSNSPCKRAIVVKKLPFQFSADAIDSKPKARPTALPEETKSSEINFFMWDDLVRHMGKRDTIIVWSNGQKKTPQRGNLTINISEVYELFKMEYPDAAIGKSKFASLRPEHVLLSNKIPQNVCVCQNHENITLIL